MGDLLDHFARERLGLWISTSAVNVDLPDGRNVVIRSGVRVRTGWPYEGLDIGQMLDDAYAMRQAGNS